MTTTSNEQRIKKKYGKNTLPPPIAKKMHNKSIRICIYENNATRPAIFESGHFYENQLKQLVFARFFHYYLI